MEIDQLRIIKTEKSRWVEIPSDQLGFTQRLRMAWGIILGSDLRVEPMDIRHQDLRTPLASRLRNTKEQTSGPGRL